MKEKARREGRIREQLTKMRETEDSIDAHIAHVKMGGGVGFMFSAKTVNAQWERRK